MENTNKGKVSNFIKTIFQIVVASIIMILIFSHLKKEIANLNFHKINYLLSNLGWFSFLSIILLGVIGMMILSSYDFIVLNAINMKENLRKNRILKISFLTNALNMILGFGGFIGAGLRYYFYKPYTNNGSQLAIGIGMILISMLSGLSMLAICVVLNILPGQTLYTGHDYLYYSLLLISLFLPIYLFINMRNPKIKNDRFLAIKLSFVSFLEWIYAALLILLILYLFVGDNVRGKELQILGIIVVAAIAGLLSMIPSGVGVFDYFVLAGLTSLSFSGEIIAATIVLYRLSYYVIPFLISVVLLMLEILQIVLKKVNKKEVS